MTINELFRNVIKLNELGGESPFVFSDPDGVRSGKSGWSFGVCQFDTQNNERAIVCLKDCGFNSSEIAQIVKQSAPVDNFNKRLADNAEIISRYDDAQLQYCLNAAGNFTEQHAIAVPEPSALLAIADYINQYGSAGDMFAAYLQSLARPIVAFDVLIWKLEHTKYGKEHPKDCQRRYDNLMAVIHGA